MALAQRSLMEHIRSGHGDEVKAALEVITETTAALTVEAIRRGADGEGWAKVRMYP